MDALKRVISGQGPACKSVYSSPATNTDSLNSARAGVTVGCKGSFLLNSPNIVVCFTLAGIFVEADIVASLIQYLIIVQAPLAQLSDSRLSFDNQGSIILQATLAKLTMYAIH
jgi:hypothetical protein